MDVNGTEEVFICPQHFEFPEKEFCCNLTAPDKYCCEGSEKSEVNTTEFTDIPAITESTDIPPNDGFVFDWDVVIIISVLVLIGGMCAVCACWSDRRQRRGHDLSM